MTSRIVRVAVTQAEPVWADLPHAVLKTCKLVSEAAAGRAQLVTFPATWIPDTHAGFDSPEMAMIRECARTAMAFARAGASAIAIADLHGVSGDLAMKLKLVAAQAGRLEPVVLGCTVDIARQDGVQAMHDTVSQGFEGRLDIVVNNAAHMEPYKPSLDSDPDVYWRTWEVDVHGLFNMGAEKTRP